jgi:hypothetical protein
MSFPAEAAFEAAKPVLGLNAGQPATLCYIKITATKPNFIT